MSAAVREDTRGDAAGREAAFLAGLLAWLNARFAPNGPAIAADTPLFAGGLINSMRVLDLIAWAERASGRAVPDALIRMDNFATPARIAAVFAGREEHARR